MIQSTTVLVLGAGSSMPYGLPSGLGLRRAILAMDPDEVHQLPIARGARRDPGDAEEFLAAFSRSHDRSIDAFLARNAQFLDIGVHAIAAALLPRETDEATLDSEPEDDHWYQYLADSMDAPWEELHENRIAFVTFNYDRSLERFLTSALANRHSRTLEEAAAIVAGFPIIHVYGKLGSLDHRAADYVPYGTDDRGYLGRAAVGIGVIAQGRDESPEFERARELFAEAENLCFLGFSFDDTNVVRLGGSSIYAGGREDSPTLLQGIRSTGSLLRPHTEWSRPNGGALPGR